MNKIWRLYDWLHIMVILFALASLALSLRYIYKFTLMFRQIKLKYQSERKQKQAQYKESMELIEAKNQRHR